MKAKKKIFNIATVITTVAVLICAAVICANQMGLAEEYDFGAGAYYYADIPGFEKLLNEDSFKSSLPIWIHIVLFLAWGWLMYRLWIWIDDRK